VGFVESVGGGGGMVNWREKRGGGGGINPCIKEEEVLN